MNLSPFPIVGKSLFADRYAYRTEIYLDQGEHTFRIFYSASFDLEMSICNIYWLRPNSFDFEIIPSYVFGNPDNCFPNNKVSLNQVRKESKLRNAISYKDNMLNIIGSSKIYTLKIYNLKGSYLTEINKNHSINMREHKNKVLLLRGFGKQGELIMQTTLIP